MTLTDLDGVVVGAMVASVNVDTKGFPSTFGMVTDVGVHDDGQPYAELLVEVPPREVRVEVWFKAAPKARTYNVARLARIDFADINPASIEEPTSSRMQGWGKKALVGAVVLPGEPHALVYAAGSLFMAARDLYVEQAAS